MTAPNTTLHRNPFAILGASYTSTRAEIIELAENQSLLGDEIEVSRARRELTTPSLRLSAELSWLPGISIDEFRYIWSGGHLQSLPSSDVGLHPLAKANLLAASAEVSLRKGWEAEALLNLGRAVQPLSVESLTELVNRFRAEAGFPEATHNEVREAFAKQRSRFKEAGWSQFRRLLPPDQTRVLFEWVSAGVVPSLIHELIDQYAFEMSAPIHNQVHEIEEALNGLSIQLASRAGSIRISSAADRLVKLVSDFDNTVFPIWKSHSDRGLEYREPWEVMIKVRRLAIDAANDYESFELAHRLTESLLAMRSLDQETKSQLREKDLQPLNSILSQVSSHPHRPATSSKVSRTRPNAPAYIPTPAEERRTSWALRIIGLLVIIAVARALITDNGADVQSSNVAARPTTAPTVQSLSRSSCSGIDPWWDDSIDRMERLGAIYDSATQITWDTSISQMKQIKRLQSTDTHPVTADGLQDAYLAYMQFLIDTLEGDYTSDYRWNLDNDRLFSDIQTESKDVANSCGFTLVD